MKLVILGVNIISILFLITVEHYLWGYASDHGKVALYYVLLFPVLGAFIGMFITIESLSAFVISLIIMPWIVLQAMIVLGVL
jgi:hypothetical protein